MTQELKRYCYSGPGLHWRNHRAEILRDAQSTKLWKTNNWTTSAAAVCFILPSTGVGSRWPSQPGQAAAGAGEESSWAGAEGAGDAEQEHGHSSWQWWWAAGDDMLKGLKHIDLQLMWASYLMFSPRSEREQLATSAQVLPHQALLLSGLWGGHPWRVPQDLQEDVLPVDVWVSLPCYFPTRCLLRVKSQICDSYFTDFTDYFLFCVCVWQLITASCLRRAMKRMNEFTTDDTFVCILSIVVFAIHTNQPSGDRLVHFVQRALINLGVFEICSLHRQIYRMLCLNSPVAFALSVDDGVSNPVHSATLFLNVLACLAFFCANASRGVDFGLSILWFVLFTPVAFICWYRPVYKAFRYICVVGLSVFWSVYFFLISFFLIVFCFLMLNLISSEHKNKFEPFWTPFKVVISAVPIRCYQTSFQISEITVRSTLRQHFKLDQ